MRLFLYNYNDLQCNETRQDRNDKDKSRDSIKKYGL